MHDSVVNSAVVGVVGGGGCYSEPQAGQKGPTKQLLRQCSGGGSSGAARGDAVVVVVNVADPAALPAGRPPQAVTVPTPRLTPTAAQDISDPHSLTPPTPVTPLVAPPGAMDPPPCSVASIAASTCDSLPSLDTRAAGPSTSSPAGGLQYERRGRRGRTDAPVGRERVHGRGQQLEERKQARQWQQQTSREELTEGFGASDRAVGRSDGNLPVAEWRPLRERVPWHLPLPAGVVCPICGQQRVG